MVISDLYNRLELSFSVSNLEIVNQNQAYIFVEKNSAVSLITNLRDVENFSHLSFFTAVDQIEDNHFQLLYMLHNYEINLDLGVLVKVDRDSSQMESIHHLWPAAATYQRELREMYGVMFEGSPGIMDNFCLEGWHDMPPMRRDFDTKVFSEETYYERPGRETYDPAEYMKSKLYPGEAESW